MRAIGTPVPSAALDEPEVGVQLAVALCRGGDVGGVELGGRDLAALDQAERVLGGEAERVDHAEPPPGPWRRRHAEEVAFAGGRVRERLVERTATAAARRPPTR